MTTHIGFSTIIGKSKMHYVALLAYPIKKMKNGIQYKNILPAVLKVILCIFDTVSIRIRIKKCTLSKLGAALGVLPMLVPL